MKEEPKTGGIDPNVGKKGAQTSGPRLTVLGTTL